MKKEEPKVYGYCRISTKKQSIARQETNIKNYNQDAIIFSEKFTGTKISRPQFNKLLKRVKAGDTIIFDSVSRMSRDAEDGTELYFDLVGKGINLVFLKEHYIDTETYKSATKNKIELIGTKEDIILNAINEYLRELAKEQIKIAFAQAQKEVDDLRQRTKEGMAAKGADEKIRQARTGTKVTTKKSIEMKAEIKKLSKDYEGNLKDVEVMKLLKIARNTYYKYKRELAFEV